MGLLRRILLTEKDVSGRPVHVHGPVMRRLMLAYLVCFGTVIALGAWQWDDKNAQDEQIMRQCVESASNREAIRDSLKRGFTSLGYVWNEKTQEPERIGPPSLAYWKEHPDELAVQLDRLRQELDGFPPIRC